MVSAGLAGPRPAIHLTPRGLPHCNAIPRRRQLLERVAPLPQRELVALVADIDHAEVVIGPENNGNVLVSLQRVAARALVTHDASPFRSGSVGSPSSRRA